MYGSKQLLFVDLYQNTVGLCMKRGAEVAKIHDSLTKERFVRFYSKRLIYFKDSTFINLPLIFLIRHLYIYIYVNENHTFTYNTYVIIYTNNTVNVARLCVNVRSLHTGH